MKNNTIALLVGILIVISVASILSTPKQIANFRGVTGRATGESNVLFNLSEEVSVLVTGNIEFGSGKIDAGSAYAELDSSLGYYNFSFTNITSTAGQTPPSRGEGTMVFDSKRNVSVLYGGSNGRNPSIRLNETWEFNHATKNWSRITSADASAGGIPGSLINYAISYDSQNEVVILFGGENTSGASQNRTWEYDGVNWTELSPSTAPSPRGKAVMAFDSLRNVSVLFGGQDVSGDSFETWEYNYSSGDWTNISTASSPAKSTDIFMIFDPGIGKMILSEGSTGQIWEYDGSDWTLISSNISADGGPPFAALPIGYDSGRNKSLWAGLVFDSDFYFTEVNFWEYNYAENRWFEIMDFEVPKNFGGFSYDSNAKEAMGFITTPINVFAGLANWTMNETWIFNYTPSGLARNSSWDVYKDYMFIENDGTVNISINYSADKDAAAFVGGDSPSFMLKGVERDVGACTNLNTSFVDITSAENELCDVLRYTNFNDRIKAAVKLKVPSNVNAGTHNSTITFTGRVV